MNKELLALLESNDDDAINSLLAMYEDSDPTDGISDSEIEAIKRRKEKQEKITKIIAICTAGITACAGVILLINKLKKKGVLNKPKAEKCESKVKKILKAFKDGLAKGTKFKFKKGLSESEANSVDSDYDDIVIFDEDLGDLQDELKTLGSNDNVNESANVYDNVVDAILERFNNNDMNAETCIALIERASERYLTESENCDNANKVTFESVVDNICESYIDGEINEEVCKMLIEAATDKYL